MTVLESDTVLELSEKDKYEEMIGGLVEVKNISRLGHVLSLEHGLLDKETRQVSWPLLLKQDPVIIPVYEELFDIHKDSDQVLKDVERSFIQLNDKYDAEEIRSLKLRLNRVINKVLNALPNLCYYQGYHDIASLVVLVFEDEKPAYEFLYCLSVRYLRDHMMKNIWPTMKQLDLIPELVKSVDMELYKIICDIQPVYALSSIISLFTHDIANLEQVSVIWDFIFCNDDPQMAIYIYVALMVYYKEDIMIDLNEMSDSSLSEKSTDYDLDVVHAVLNKFVSVHMNVSAIDALHELENVLKLAKQINKKHSLANLASYKNISNYSFLKRKTYSMLILSLQIKEVDVDERRSKEKSRKPLTRPQKANQILITGNNVLRLSLGVGILGVLFHTVLRNGPPGSRLGLGLGLSVSRAFDRHWKSCIDYISDQLY